MSSVNLKNLSIQELKKLVKDKNEEVKKLEQEKEKEKLILAYEKLQNKEEKLTQEKKEIKQKSKSKSKSKQKKKDFDDYYQECIKGKDIPKDAPEYFKKALEQAKKEYEKGIILEKSALANFAEKYVIDGIPGLIPIEYFSKIVTQIKYFLRNHRNTKVRMILVCKMERQIIEKSKGESKISYDNDNAYFHSRTHVNLEKTDVKVILKEMIIEILGNLIIYQKKRFRLVFQRSYQFRNSHS